ncbi:hypothetical protein M407DRAFT_14925 [Tulasnella calospora MUT 4182]|uniref:D-serine dehydratase n=1 Tax=Tulasnella calospora MUT 4182 TaxID=1051891 RepID=A0A0C3M0P9_9AGAM|nr:hypothetical protein M407DRAFT_14925 [Tulasnella calospora MUT 4182]
MDATVELATLPSKAALVNAFVGKKVSSLRTPAFVVNRAIVARNCAEMQENASRWGARFRAHIKTHKTTEGVRHQLAATDSDRAIIVSTLMEAWQVIKADLVKDGTVKDLLYGLPVPVTKIPELSALKNELDDHGGSLRLLVDHPEQVSKLQAYAQASPWSVFVKVDPGYKRAGVVPGSTHFLELLQSIHDAASAIELYGFYCHAGNSYGSKSLNDASSFLSDEIKTVSEAARIAASSRFSRGGTTDRKPFVLSVGSTPTAHVPSNASESATALAELRSSLGNNNVLELHAGNYIFHDLQQLATSLISPPSIAFRVLATVVSVYPGRGMDGADEALIDVGGIGLSKDTGPMEGYGKVVAIFPPDPEGGGGERNPRSSTTNDSSDGGCWLLDMDCGWTLVRISQEHGILRQDSGGSAKLTVGSIVGIVGQHACLIAANHPWYYVVESEGQVDAKDEEVVDIWVPWKGW